MVRDQHRKEVHAKAELQAEERVLDALVGENASQTTRDSFRQKLRSGELDDKEIELEVSDSGSIGLPTFDIPGSPGAQMGMINLNDMLGKALGGRTKPRRMTVAESYDVLIDEEAERLRRHRVRAVQLGSWGVWGPAARRFFDECLDAAHTDRDIDFYHWSSQSFGDFWKDALSVLMARERARIGLAASKGDWPRRIAEYARDDQEDAAAYAANY